MNDYLLTREVAELLRTPESTVRYWRHVGTGPPSLKVGRRVLYRREAILAWLQEQEGAGDRSMARQLSREEAIAERARRPGLRPPQRAAG